MGEERLGEPPAGSADQVFGQHPFAVASLLATRSGRGSKVAKQHEPIISERPDPIHNRHRFHFYVPFLALIPRLVDQDPWAQLRRPMDMIRQG